MNKYRKRHDQVITAVQFDLDTEGFIYQKWGGSQRCKPQDWLVNSNGETYTVDDQVFRKTYKEVSPGCYKKSTSVWAEIAAEDGAIETKEGQSKYNAGDYLVYNNEDRTDGYCMSAERFESIYETVD